MEGYLYSMSNIIWTLLLVGIELMQHRTQIEFVSSSGRYFTDATNKLIFVAKKVQENTMKVKLFFFICQKRVYQDVFNASLLISEE